jgi:aspartate/methionine/tyrosine aminotransferase
MVLLCLPKSIRLLSTALNQRIAILKMKEKATSQLGSLLSKSNFDILISDRFSTPEHPFSENEVFIASGCFGALYITFSALMEEGSNILVPKPGFPIVKGISDNLNFEVKYYNLQEDNKWMADLDHMKSLIDDKTKAILVNSPSNPCG